MLSRQIKSISKTGEIKFFYSINEASKELGIGRTNISGVLNGRSKTAGGYFFKELKPSEYRINSDIPKDILKNFNKKIEDAFNNYLSSI